MRWTLDTRLTKERMRTTHFVLVEWNNVQTDFIRLPLGKYKPFRGGWGRGKENENDLNIQTHKLYKLTKFQPERVCVAFACLILIYTWIIYFDRVFIWTIIVYRKSCAFWSRTGAPTNKKHLFLILIFRFRLCRFLSSSKLMNTTNLRINFIRAHARTHADGIPACVCLLKRYNF